MSKNQLTLTVKNCFECPFRISDMPIFIDGGMKCLCLSCGHPLYKDNADSLTVLLSDEPGFKIFDMCPLKNGSITVLLNGNDTVSNRIEEVIDLLVEKYPNTVSWGGENRTIKFGGYKSTPNDVVVYEYGVRGPADWFRVIDGRFHHMEYTSHKETYNIDEFKEYIIKMDKYNKENE